MAITFVTALTLGCSTGQTAPQGSQESKTSGGAPAQPATPVALAVAQPSPIEDATEYVATLKSLKSTSVQPQIDGQITQIFVKSGDRVTPGQPVMQIDPRRQQAAVSSQEAERASKEAAVAYAQQQAQRANELLAAGAISRQEQEQAATALQTARADLESLQAQVRQQEVQLRYFTVAAPTEGVIGDVPVRVGSLVSTTTVLTTIDQNQTLEIYVNVPVERSSDLRRGLPIQILSSDGTESLASTTANFISAHVDDQTQSILVKGSVANSNGRLRNMQYVRARIVWKRREGLTVPVTAVVRINGQFFAFIAEGTGNRLVARQRAIQVGPITGNAYPVLSGIAVGDRVVTSGAQKLADGAPIAPQA